MKKRRLLGVLVSAAAVAAAVTFARPRTAAAVIVERVVAVVGERPILLTDLRKRARPFLVQIHAQSQNPAQTAGQETEMFRDLLNRMIDERLEEQAADKAHVTVSAEEIDRGIRNKADQLNIPPRQLLAEAKKTGLSEQDYRDELRRQILEGKLIQLRVLSRVRVTDEDARAAYTHWLKELGGERILEPRFLVRRIDPTWTQQQRAEEEQAMQSWIAQVRSGGDFCPLVKQYSHDPATAPNCGSRGQTPLASLLPDIQNAIVGLKDGEITDVINLGDQANILVQVWKAPHVPKFEEVQREMQERAMQEVIERQRKLWLQEIRRGVYIDVRL